MALYPNFTVRYVAVGGSSFSVDEFTFEQAFSSLEHAAREWARRRSDITGQFPTWGNDRNADAVVSVRFEDLDGWVATDTTDAWAPDRLEPIIGEMAHYYDD